MTVKRYDGQPDDLLAISDRSRRKLADALKDTESANEILGPETDQILFHLEQFRHGVSAPEDVTIGSTPTIHLLRFHDTAQKLSGHTIFPRNLDTTKGIHFVLQIVLVNNQQDGDTLDLTLDYITAGMDNPVFTNPSSQVTASLTLTQRRGLSAGTLYEVPFILPTHDEHNPILNAHCIGLEFFMSNLDEVAEFYLGSAYIDYFKLK